MSVAYRLFLIVFIVLVFAPAAAQDKPERRYRVELIVVRHLEGHSDSTPQPDLRDLSELLDLHAPVLPESGETQPQPTPSKELQDPATLTGQEPEEPATVRVDEMSDTMREAWRRLRGSAGFRPELFRAWEQSGDQPFPRLRIHDDEILFEIEPETALGELPVDEHGALVFSDQTVQQQGNDIEEEPEQPPRRYYFRIDGDARLTRSRFLNLDLDIELREPLFEPLTAASDPEAGNGSDELPAGREAGEGTEGIPASEAGPVAASVPGKKIGPAAEASAFRIHRIEQRRQVKAEQMEYFDGPVIGILALVTGFDAVSQDSTTASMGDGLQPVE